MSFYIASLDQGTTSTRCIVFNQLGEIISQAQIEHKQIYPKPGWVEHNPLEIWNNTVEVFYKALSNAGLTYAHIKGIGITNQRETAVLWDKQTGRPLHNAIVWQDTRTDRICQTLAQDGGQDRFRAATGLPLATYFSGPKISWLIKNIEAVKKAVLEGTALFGTMDSWLIWNLSGGKNGGVHVTDCTNASRTMLMDLSSFQWDDTILNILGIPHAILPKIKSSSEIYGYAKFEKDLIPICGDLGDQQAALFGQACFQPGAAKNTYGTGCFMLLNTGAKLQHSKNGLLSTVGYQIGSAPPVFALEGSIAIAGSLVQWLRDNLNMIHDSSEIEQLAKSVEDNGDVYFVPAFSGLFAPYWQHDARGVIAGLTSFTNKGHIARAALEATAYQTKEVMDAMHADSGIQLKSLKVDGGMVVNELLMQFQADILDAPVIRPTITETTALGAAYAAGLAVGYWEDEDQLTANWSMDKKWDPQMAAYDRNRYYQGWKKAVKRTMGWLDQQPII